VKGSGCRADQWRGQRIRKGRFSRAVMAITEIARESGSTWIYMKCFLRRAPRVFTARKRATEGKRFLSEKRRPWKTITEFRRGLPVTLSGMTPKGKPEWLSLWLAWFAERISASPSAYTSDKNEKGMIASRDESWLVKSRPAP